MITHTHTHTANNWNVLLLNPYKDVCCCKSCMQKVKMLLYNADFLKNWSACTTPCSVLFTRLSSVYNLFLFLHFSVFMSSFSGSSNCWADAVLFCRCWSNIPVLSKLFSLISAPSWASLPVFRPGFLLTGLLQQSDWSPFRLCVGVQQWNLLTFTAKQHPLPC